MSKIKKAPTIQTSLKETFGTIDNTILKYKRVIDDLTVELDQIEQKIQDAVKNYKEIQKKASVLNAKLEKTQTIFYKGFDITEYYEQGKAEQVKKVVDSVVTTYTVFTNGKENAATKEPQFITMVALKKLNKSKALKKIFKLTRESNMGPATIEIVSPKGDQCILELIPATEADFLIKKVTFYSVTMRMSLSGLEMMVSDLAKVSLKTIQRLFS